MRQRDDWEPVNPGYAAAAYWVLALAFCAWASCGGAAGCVVRSVTTCVTYDRGLRPGGEYVGPRDSAGASACVETGPPESD